MHPPTLTLQPTEETLAAINGTITGEPGQLITTNCRLVALTASGEVIEAFSFDDDLSADWESDADPGAIVFFCPYREVSFATDDTEALDDFLSVVVQFAGERLHTELLARMAVQAEPCDDVPTKKPVRATKEVTGGLFVLIVFMPGLFAWVTLRRGYSTFARLMSFGWLLLPLFVGYADHRLSETRGDNRWMQPSPMLVSHGETVEFWSWKVDEIELQVIEDWRDAEGRPVTFRGGNVRLQVSYRIENLGYQTRPDPMPRLYVTDREHIAYRSTIAVGVHEPPPDIPAGETVERELLFTVPKTVLEWGPYLVLPEDPADRAGSRASMYYRLLGERPQFTFEMNFAPIVVR